MSSQLIPSFKSRLKIGPLFLSLKSFKGVKKAQQKRNCIAQGVVTDNNKSNAANKNKNKNIIINILIFLRGN